MSRHTEAVVGLLVDLTDANLLALAHAKGIPIDDPLLFRQALTHKSVTPDTPLMSNERLEFVGDAILSHVIAHRLYELLPTRNEGALAKARSLIVCKSSLASAATRLGLTELLLLGASEEALGGRSRSSLIADAYEAVIAAISFAQGWECARDFILETLEPEMQHVLGVEDWRDPKTAFQEWCQANGHQLPDYKIIDEQGRPHDRTFVAQVLVDGKVCGSGVGKTKREAQQAAASKGLALNSKKNKGG